MPLCRALRETLTSLRELSHFTREVRLHGICAVCSEHG